MNLGEIRTRVQRQFGDVSGAQITTDDIDRWANDALVDICRKTEVLVSTQEISLVANTESYALSADFLFAKRVTVDGLLINRTTLEELDILSGNREQADYKGAPRKYHIWNNKIYLYPKPESSGTNNLDIWYVRRAAALAAPADVPEIPTQMHEEIVRFCLIRAKELNEDFDQAALIEADYERRLSNAMFEAQWPYSESYPSVRSLPGDEY